MKAPDRLKLTGCRCQCPSCGEHFASPRAFDRHRVGSYAKPGEWQGSRRCLTLPEMIANGWARTGRGYLLTPDPRRAGARLEGHNPTQSATGVEGRIDDVQ